LGDAKRIIMRRIVINLLIGLVILAPAVVAIGWKHSFDAVTWIERLGFWVVSVIYFAESMRLVFAPEYRLSGSVVLSLAIISAIKLAMVIVAICIFAVLLVTWSYVFGALTHLRSPAYQTGGPVLQAVMFCMVTFLWTGFSLPVCTEGSRRLRRFGTLLDADRRRDVLADPRSLRGRLYRSCPAVPWPLAASIDRQRLVLADRQRCPHLRDGNTRRGLCVAVYRPMDARVRRTSCSLE
jgi:hypothetical protein